MYQAQSPAAAASGKCCSIISGLAPKPPVATTTEPARSVSSPAPHTDYATVVRAEQPGRAHGEGQLHPRRERSRSSALYDRQPVALWNVPARDTADPGGMHVLGLELHPEAAHPLERLGRCITVAAHHGGFEQPLVQGHDVLEHGVCAVRDSRPLLHRGARREEVTARQPRRPRPPLRRPPARSPMPRHPQPSRPRPARPRPAPITATS